MEKEGRWLRIGTSGEGQGERDRESSFVRP